MRTIDADPLLAAYDAMHEGPPGKARALILSAPTVITPAERALAFIADDVRRVCMGCTRDGDWQPERGTTRRMAYTALGRVLRDVAAAGGLQSRYEPPKVEVVRCIDCRFSVPDDFGTVICKNAATPLDGWPVSVDWYCADGQQRKDKNGTQ